MCGTQGAYAARPVLCQHIERKWGPTCANFKNNSLDVVITLVYDRFRVFLSVGVQFVQGWFGSVQTAQGPKGPFTTCGQYMTHWKGKKKTTNDLG